MTRSSLRDASGFTLLEMLIAVTIVIILLATTAMLMPGVVTLAKADSGSSQLLTALRTAREQAVTERRNVTISFVNPNRIEVRRDDLGLNGAGAIIVSGQTLVGTTILEQGMEFLRFPADVPDTPDGFAPVGNPIEFSGGQPWQFTSEGTLVSQSGDVVNGTIFLARPNEPQTSRAITLFGATALLREWKWNGAAWAE